jgi:hypothetical protein
MSIEYELHFADSRPTEELLAAAGLGELPGLLPFPGKPQASRAHIIREAYGFTSKADLVLRVDPSFFNKDDGYTGNYTLIRAAMALLRAAQGDMVLLFNWEKPMLMRRDGKLLLNNDGGWWDSPARLGLVDLPYVMEELPSL